MVDAKIKELHKNHIARIYHPSYGVKGAGLLIYDKYIITCAHVVADALDIAHSTPEKPSDLVKVDFLLFLWAYAKKVLLNSTNLKLLAYLQQ